MTQPTYTKIFSIAVHHPYFKDGFARDLFYKPNEPTQLLLKGDSFKILTAHQGIECYFAGTSPLDELLRDLTQQNGESTFEFDILTSEPSFHNYTAPPLGFTEGLWYSSGDPDNQIENNSITLHPRREEASVQERIARLTIRFEDLINTEGPLACSIRFDVLHTIWQYYIINSSALDLRSMSIQSASGIPFSEPEEVHLENGQSALLLTSEQFIPLSESPIHRFDLVTLGAETKTLFKGLPIPNPSQLSVIQMNGGKVACSPMYVYI